MASTRRSSASWDDWLWKYIVPPLAVLVLFFVVMDFPESIDAANNKGAPGTFTSTRSDCHARGGCTYYGRFVTDDGTVTLKNVFIEDGVEEVGV